MTREEKFMMEAIALSKKAIENNEGGPFWLHHSKEQ